MAYPLRKVARVDRSPMNKKVWCAQLHCGHDAFLPGRKPRLGQMISCEKCPLAREKCIDPDYRKDPKTDRFCCRCQRDILLISPTAEVYLRSDGHVALHPEDVASHALPGDLGWQLIGMDCVRVLGREWVRMSKEKIEDERD